MGPQSELKQLLDSVLISGLPEGAKEAIDAALGKGGDPAVLQQIIDRAADGYPMTKAACEAYLEQRLKERKEECGG